LKWLVLSIISLVLWGLWSILIKIALKYADWCRVALLSSTAALATTIMAVILAKPKSELNQQAIYYAMIAGAIGVLGNLAFNMALEIGSTSIVTSVSALYPLITLILGKLVLREEITVTQLIGIILAVIAIILMSIKNIG